MRLPFRFGMVTLEEASLCTLRLEVEVAGRRAAGYASDLLVPKWFEKDPDSSTAEDVARLRRSVEAAAAGVVGAPQRTVFEHWAELYDELVRPSKRARRLVHGFGVALVERALVDGLCRLDGGSFCELLRSDRLGFRPGRLHPELADWRHDRQLADHVPRAMRVRHTVGLADALRSRPSDAPGDGLPRSLEEDVQRYGLRLFKIKVSGHPDEDVARLNEIAEVLAETTGGSYRATLDGNEQFETLDQLSAVLERLAQSPVGRQLTEGLLYIEQPLARASSLEPGRLGGLKRLRRFGELILDEADSDVETFRQAVALGYRGVSVKNCKGLFRALANAGLCRTRPGLFQSSEDLTNVPLLPLQQDLATAAAIGLDHSERNGHHYFRGLDHLPAGEVDAALERHSDLYEDRVGLVSLRIEDGAIPLGTVMSKGYGTTIESDLDARREGARCDWFWENG